MNYFSFRSNSSSVFAGGLVASLLSAVAVYLVGSNAPLAPGSAYWFVRHVTFSSVIFAAVFAVLWQSCGIFLGLYGKAREDRSSGFAKPFACSVAMTLLLGLYMVLMAPRPPLIKVMAVFLGCALACEIVRMGIERLIQQRSSRVVIVGCNRLAAKAWREFRIHRDRHIQIVGFVNQPSCTDMMPDMASRCLGKLEALPQIVLNQDIDDVIVATSPGSDSRILEQSVALAGSLGARILCLKDVCGIHPETADRDYEGALFELVPAPQLSGFRQIAKRVCDVTVSATVVLLASPFVFPLALYCFVRRSPITYRERVQLGFRRSRFRRWRLDSAPSSPHVKLFLEIVPSMWNVLCGHMSLVGPPPVSESQIANADAATLAGRFDVRPGVFANPAGDSVAAAFVTNTTGFSNWSLKPDVKSLTRAFHMGMGESAVIESQVGAP